MRKKIGIFLICMLLIFSTTSLALTTFSRDELNTKLSVFNTSPIHLSNSNVWMKTFDKTIFDFGNSAQQTNDGGYIIIGFTISLVTNDSDIWLVKIDTYGNKVWDKTFGGADFDIGSSVQQTDDGGYIITGSTNSSDGDWSDTWLIKTNSDGIEVWNRTYGETNEEYGYSVKQTADEGYIIIGSTSSPYEPYGISIGDFWLIKTNSNGLEEWNKTFGGKNDDVGTSVQQTNDGGYIITGSTESFGAGREDVWFVKTDTNGNKVWDKTFGGIDDDMGYSVQQTIDGGYIITGFTYSFGIDLSDVWLIKTDSNGVEMWNKTFGGIDDDMGYSVQQTDDGGYIITGETSSLSDTDTYVYLVKTDGDGNKMWDETFGGPGVSCGMSVQQTSDDGYIIGGFAGSYDIDFLLIKTDSQGKSKTLSLGYLWFEKLLNRFPMFEKILNQILL